MHILEYAVFNSRKIPSLRQRLSTHEAATVALCRGSAAFASSHDGLRFRCSPTPDCIEQQGG